MAPTTETKRVSRTKNDLPADTRTEMIALCNAMLADCIDLETQTKQDHWNVRGHSFCGLHKLFDEINEAVEGYVDLIAERAGQLGGLVKGKERGRGEGTAPPTAHTRD